jgi:hypothetical protein
LSITWHVVASLLDLVTLGWIVLFLVSVLSCSVGVMDPTWAKALYIEDDQGNKVTLVTIDAIGSDGPLVDLAHTYAVTMGFPLSREQVIFGASHSHSGPGAVSPSFLWVRLTLPG